MKKLSLFLCRKIGGMTDDVKNYELAKIDYSNGLSIKEISNKYNVTVATVRKWKSRYNWDSVTKKRDKSVTSKKAKEVARVLIEEGASISEVANQTELHKSTLKRLSSKENLQQTQLENLKNFRDEYRKEIKKNKLKRLLLNNKNLEKLAYEINNKETTSKADFEKVKLSEEIEQLIFESDRIERLEKIEIEKQKLELEKAKATREKEQKDKTGSFLDKLEEFI